MKEKSTTTTPKTASLPTRTGLKVGVWSCGKCVNGVKVCNSEKNDASTFVNCTTGDAHMLV
jgi:hypothetical protein